MKLAAERRTMGASSAGAKTTLGSSGTVTNSSAATQPTVITDRHGPFLAMLDEFVATEVEDMKGR
jgi:hypothetical protein